MAVLSQPQTLQELGTIESVFEKLILISDPIEFEGEARNQALKRLKDLFHMSMWYHFSRPSIDDFGGRYTEELNDW